MNEKPDNADSFEDPDWLDEFRDIANRELSSLDESASCEQVHPIVAHWYENLMEGEPPASRDSVLQAMACLSTEILNQIPDDLFDRLMEIVSEDEMAAWVEYVLMVGRAFEVSLRSGDLDDL